MKGYLILLLLSIGSINYIVAKKIMTISLVNHHSYFVEDEAVSTISDLQQSFETMKDSLFRNDSVYIVRLRVYPDIKMELVHQTLSILKAYRDSFSIQGITHIETKLFTKIIDAIVEKEVFSDIPKRNTTSINVSKSGEVQIRNQATDLSNFKIKLKQYIVSDAGNPSYPELFIQVLPKIGVIHCPTAHIVVMSYDKDTDYEETKKVFHLVYQVYHEVKLPKATEYFKKKYGQLKEEDKAIIDKIYPPIVKVNFILK